MQHAATAAQVKFTLCVLQATLNALLEQCYTADERKREHLFLQAQQAFDSIQDMCFDTGDAITVAECVHYLHSWGNSAQQTVLDILQARGYSSVEAAVMQNA